MVLGLLTIAAIPSTIGVCQALSAQKKQNAAQKERVKFMATVELSLAGEAPIECPVVLANGKLYVDHPGAPAPGHKFAGYYFTYPSEEAFLGLVSTIADDPPMLNWIYVDKDTDMMRHAGRKDTIGHIVGPWGWTDDERWLTLGGLATGFMAAEDEDTHTWQIFLNRGETTADESRHASLAGRCLRQVPISIRRRVELGMESRYVRDSDRQ